MLPKIIVVCIVALLSLGCSSNPSAREEAIVDIAIQYGVAKYKEQSSDGERSEENIVRVATALKAVTAGDAVTLLTLQEFVDGEIAKLELSPADRVLANALVRLVVAEIQVKIGEGLLSPERRVRVDQILDLIIAAARA